MSVRFYLHKRADATAEKPLRLIVCRGGRQFGISLEITLRSSEWNQRSQKVAKSTPGATDINAELRRLKLKAQTLALKYRDDDELKAALRDHLELTPKVPEKTLLQYFDDFTSYKEKRVKASTMQVWNSLKQHLEGFVDEALTVAGIGPGFVEDFQTHLLNQKLANRTVNKYATRLRTFLKWLEERGKLDAAPKAKPLKTADSDVVRLTLAELAALRSADLSAETDGHEAARDIFLMCCYTGQRIGDVQKMAWKDVQGDAWYLREEKTGVVRRVPLITPALEILEKYDGEKWPLPRLSDQKTNSYLKTIAKAAGINVPVTIRSQKGGKIETETVPKHEAISTHAGRKTYISLMMESGVSAKEMLGVTHSDLRSLKHYAGASEAHLRKAMHGVFETQNSNAG